MLQMRPVWVSGNKATGKPDQVQGESSESFQWLEETGSYKQTLSGSCLSSAALYPVPTAVLAYHPTPAQLPCSANRVCFPAKGKVGLLGDQEDPGSHSQQIKDMFRGKREKH